MTSTGALTAYSGAKTGRSPLDKRVVKEPGSDKNVWWGPVNKPMSPDVSNFLSRDFVGVGLFQPQGLCDGWRVSTCHEVTPPASPVHIAHLPKLVRGGFPAARCTEMFLVQRKNKTPQWLFGRKHHDATAPISSEGLGQRSRNVVWRTDQSRFPELN